MTSYLHDIRDYGAVGDGTHKDTASIQSAIDRCSAGGGGRVIVPPGVFLTGTLFLKDRVDLHLLPGAIIRGSPDLVDYCGENCFPQNSASAIEKTTGGHLIVGLEVKDVAISGRGAIDGNSGAFFKKDEESGKFIFIYGKRPSQMIYFCECERVQIDEVALYDSTYWTCFCHGCTDVFIRNVRIRNPRATPNGDGLDIDSCRNVVVTNCIIDSGDDCITFRGNNGRLKHRDMACENVVVSNCVLSSDTCAFRVGVGNGVVRNCAAANCVIRNSRTGIHFVSRWSPSSGRGTDIENIRFSNMLMDAYIPFWIGSGAGAEGCIKNLVFNDMEITAESGAFICGLPGMPIEDVVFRNIAMTIKKSGRPVRPPPYDDNLREWVLRPDRIPHAFYARHVGNLAFDCMRIRRDQALQEAWAEMNIDEQ